ncbi:CDKL3 isoform 10, partial [Pongo abelii]
TKGMEVKQIKMLKRESKKTDSSKIPTLLNMDQNQEKQEFIPLSLLSAYCPIFTNICSQLTIRVEMAIVRGRI